MVKEPKKFVISVDDDFDGILKKVEQTNDEILLSFNLKEKDLNSMTGKRIANFLCKLKQKQIRFRVSKPLPRCVLGMHFIKTTNRIGIPKNCYECEELFTVKDEEIISCPSINKKGPKVYYLTDKNQVHEFFNILRLKKEPAEKCKSCFHFRRSVCDGLCFRS